MKEDVVGPAAPKLLHPVERAAVPARAVAFRWEPAPEAISYSLQVARDPDFADIVVDQEVGGTTQATLPLPAAEEPAPYFWRARSRDTHGWGPFGFMAAFSAEPGTVVPEAMAAGKALHAGGEAGETSLVDALLLLAAVGFVVALLFIAAFRYSDFGVNLADDETPLPPMEQNEQAASLEAYQYDADTDTYRIPIDSAMSLVVREQTTDRE